ncbi:MAG: hypothetical protein K0S09_466 [Sphingobacteriaceae bacterium]|jgi:hypothetical protein|nr:hypothetical protein [Sphingobacteriaceae bacterium]
MYRFPVLLFLLSATLVSCSSGTKKEVQQDDTVVHDSQKILPPVSTPPKQQAPVNRDSLLLSLSRRVLTSLSENDYATFATHIHPKLGIRFSPYAHVDTATNILLSRERFLALAESGDKLTWGSYDGSGQPISLSVADYFKKFVYNADFLHPEKFSVNHIAQQGNVASNLEQVYQRCDFTESYFSGFDKKYNGMDWCVLRLVFKEYAGKQYLVGVVHAQWTI